jgi:NitT/TauT family transport system permease protein
MTRHSSNTLPMLVVALAAIAIYFPTMISLNASQAERLLSRGAELNCTSPLSCAFNLRSPVIPAPNQLLEDLPRLYWPVTDSTTVPFNAFFTGLETLLGLLLGALVGLLLAVLLTVSRAFERAVLPWLVASQTVPIIAIAPMLAVVLGANGVQGLLPKVLISAYIAFFPIAIGVAKGFRSPDPLQLDLMRTYNANPVQTFSKLRFPSSVPFLFTAFKIAMAAALIGAIVAESSTITDAGLGRMLSENSKASDARGLWLIMIGSALLGIGLVSLVGVVERLVTPWRRER